MVKLFTNSALLLIWKQATEKSFNRKHMVEYLEFVEEYKNKSEFSLFDKVKIIAARTRDIYEGKTSKAISEHGLESRKPSTVAHYEMIKGYIEPNIHEKEEKADDFLSDIEID